MMSNWPPRDQRQLVALLLLGGGGPAMTAFAWHLATLTAEKSDGPWAVAYALYGVLGLLGIIFTGFSYVLGKRVYRGKIGNIEVDSSGGDDNPEGIK